MHLQWGSSGRSTCRIRAAHFADCFRFPLAVLLLLICELARAPEQYLFANPPGDQGHEDSVSEISAALAKSLTSIHSLSCEFEQVISHDGRGQRSHWAYTRDGDKWRITEYSASRP